MPTSPSPTRLPRRAADGSRAPGRRAAVTAAWWLTGVALSVFVLFVLVRSPGQESFWQNVVAYDAVLIGAAVLCWCSAAADPRERAAWRWVAASQALNVVGNAWFTLVLSPQADPPYLSFADVLFIAGYLLLGVAVVVLTRSRVRRVHAATWLDAAVAALAAVALVAASAFAPLVALSGGTGAEVVVNLAYPLVDVVLLAVLLGAVAVMGLRADGPVLAVGVGLLLYLGGDVAYLLADAAGTYDEGGAPDLVWLAAVVVLALGARARPRPGREGTGPADEARLGWRVLLVPAVANVASLALLVVGWGDRLPLAAGACAAACSAAAMVRAVVTFRAVRDVTRARQQARTDDLTGLANRRALYERCDALLAAGPVAAPPGETCLLLLDLDSFKEVNDALGHHAGDALLQHVAQRLDALFGGDELLARLGGDEFAVLLPATTASRAVEVAEAVLAALAEPFVVDEVRLHVGASVGVAAGGHPARTRVELMRCADVAMYQAKTTRAGAVLFTDAAGSSTGERLALVEQLHEAFERGELTVHLQPQVRLRRPGPALAGAPDGSCAGAPDVVGVEALVRWQHPVRGLLAPPDFLGHVERAGLQRLLATTVLDLSLAAARSWWEQGVRVPVSVNLTAADVVDLALPEVVAAALARHGLPPQALTVELTEEALVHQHEGGGQVLAAIKAAGSGVSIDDYGTGYASLAYLRTLPAEELKLDRAFTEGVLSDPRAGAIVRHTAALAHDLGLHLVAEGIETAEVMDRLAELGCDRGQGYHVARPMALDALLDWLAAGVPPPSGDRGPGLVRSTAPA